MRRIMYFLTTLVLVGGILVAVVADVNHGHGPAHGDDGHGEATHGEATHGEETQGEATHGEEQAH